MTTRLLQTHHPLDAEDAFYAADGSLNVLVADDRARFVLRVKPDRVDVASGALACSLPTDIGATASAGSRRAYCLGPDEWYLLAATPEAGVIWQSFAAIYPTCVHSMTDVSDRDVGIQLRGAGARRALNSACPRDLDGLDTDRAARTVFDGLPIVVMKSGTESYRLEVWRSHAAYIWQVLTDAARQNEAIGDSKGR